MRNDAAQVVHPQNQCRCWIFAAADSEGRLLYIIEIIYESILVDSCRNRLKSPKQETADPDLLSSRALVWRAPEALACLDSCATGF